MTRDGLTEENLHDGSVKDISHRSRGRPETKEEFVPERERKKAENEDSKSGKGKRLHLVRGPSVSVFTFYISLFSPVSAVHSPPLPAGTAAYKFPHS